MSQQGIADLLNVGGGFCPAEYKRSLGMKYAFGFKHNLQSKWPVGAVGRILKNPLYIGVIDAYEPIIVEKNLEFVAVLLAEDMAVKRIDRQLDEMKADYEQAMHFKMN